jgi:hypothetical protein
MRPKPWQLPRVDLCLARMKPWAVGLMISMISQFGWVMAWLVAIPVTGRCLAGYCPLCNGHAKCVRTVW